MSAPSTRELKKGSAELLILSSIEARARHGYDIARWIEGRSDGAVRFHAASLYRCCTVSKSAA
jgi:DNA-binding PadR family transcriptional regulator